MQGVNHFIHAHRITPWRLHRQWTGNFLLVVVALAMIAALYLDVTSRAAISGREIQDLTVAISTSQHLSADLQTQLAAVTSAAMMEQRALALGFTPIEADQAEYLMIEGYAAPQPEILSTSSQPQLRAPSVPPEYTQSLLDWFDQQFNARLLSGAVP